MSRTQGLKYGFASTASVLGLILATPALAQTVTASPQPIQRQLDAAMELIREQSRRLDSQAAEIAALRARVEKGGAAAPVQAANVPRAAPTPASPSSPPPPGSPALAQSTIQPLEKVGQAPEDSDRPLEIAVLDSQGSVVSRKGQLTGEVQFDYARSDRSRAVFRGIELIESILVGVFDINESRQDIITGSGSLRYGLTNRLEVGIRLPYVYRSDTSIVTPIAGSTNNDGAATIDSSVKGNGIGDLELSARYQFRDGRDGSPFLIANLQGILPTGRDPFAIPRDTLGRPTSAATGAGFYGISPSITAILPSDPVVLFGTLGYTFNLGKNVDTRIPPVIISYVDPGDSIAVSAGIGIAFNQRATLNIGYAHNWAFGTKTRTRLIEPTPGWPGDRETTSRQLQIGRLLFGVTYRISDRASLNWSVEVGATEDATDVRTSVRIPLILLSGG